MTRVFYAILWPMLPGPRAVPPGVFIPGRDDRVYLFARHRQPLPANVARAYIQEFSSPGDLVIDPFAAGPTVSRAAFECGRRALAVDSNPLVAFAAALQVSIPSARDVSNALARWGEVQKENEPLRDHIAELYAGVCSNCGGPITVDYYVWARTPNVPVEKVYACPACGPRRDAATEADRARAAEIRPRGFHYHLLLERVAASESPHYNLLRELLTLYTPRNLYALVTLTLKLDAAFPEGATRDLLIGCLLHALDVGTTLYPSIDGLPERQTPETFVEVNIWRALEAAAAALGSGAPGLRLARSPADVVDATEPCLFVGQGSAHALAEAISSCAALVLTSPARLDPRFWELSYLWTRWTLGKAPSRLLEPFLDEERQRWGWYGAALAASLRDTARLLRDDGRLVVGFPSGSHAMIEALCLAAASLYSLDSFAFRPVTGSISASEFGALRGEYRVVWLPKPSNAPARGGREVALDIHRDSLIGAMEILAARGEPLAFSWVHHAALQQLARAGTLAGTLAATIPPRDNAFQFLHRELEAGLKEGYARDLDHWKEPGRVLWLRRQPPHDGAPLCERVEQAVREMLAREKRIAQLELEDRVLARFPGLLTPELEWIELCASAYADLQEGEWCWREEDVDSELAQALDLVARLGEAMNFELGSAPGFDLLWRDEKVVPASSAGGLKELRVREDSHLFLFRPRADLRELLKTPAAPLRGLLVIPETQVELTRQKLVRLPTLRRPLREAGWDFLRIPSVELLLHSSSVERAEFQLAIGLEPPLAKGKEQMELF